MAFKDVPTKPRTYFAITRARKIYNTLYGYKLPVEPLEIVDYFKWGYKTEYLNKISKNDGLDFDAVTTYSRITQKFLITMDIDSIKKCGDRFNFSLAHEIGHIILGHLDGFDTENLTDEEHKVIETEADIFAGELLMPKQGIIKSRLHTIEELAEKFNVSKLAMETRLNFLNIKNDIIIPTQNEKKFKVVSNFI